MELHGWANDVFIALMGLFGVGPPANAVWNLRRERALLRHGTRTHAIVVGGSSWWWVGRIRRRRRARAES